MIAIPSPTWPPTRQTVRRVGLGLAIVLAALVIGAAVSLYLKSREASAQEELNRLLPAYRQAMSSKEAAALDATAQTLEQFLKESSSTRAGAEGAYLFGNLHYARGSYDAAIAAYDRAAGDSNRTVTVMSRLNRGYALEAAGRTSEALQAYTQLLALLSTQHFLYVELLLAKARTEELLDRKSDAVASYQRLLAERPEHPQAETSRIRLAMLGGTPKPAANP